jgi:hypothetical protein
VAQAGGAGGYVDDRGGVDEVAREDRQGEGCVQGARGGGERGGGDVHDEAGSVKRVMSFELRVESNKRHASGEYRPMRVAYCVLRELKIGALGECDLSLVTRHSSLAP